MDWVDLEMNDLNIGDERLDKRVKLSIERLSSASASSLPACFKTRSELVAAYRLFDNDFVTSEKILEPHYQSVARRAKAQPVVLLLNDTSSLDYTSRDVEGLGVLEKPYTKGVFLHPILAVTPDRVSLGLIDSCVWIRSPNQNRRKMSGTARSRQSIEEKESFRWLQSYRAGSRFAAEIQETKFIFIADRECDIVELLAEAVKKKQQVSNMHILVRAQYDRVLVDESEEVKLKKTMETAPLVTRINFQIPSRGSQKGRPVTQSIRAQQVVLQGKVINRRVVGSSVTMNAVLCIEESPPHGLDPVVWLLLTNLPINNEEDVLNVVNYYLCRWEIETFFNVLKNGCKVEDKGLKTVTRLKVMLSLYMIVAWRVMFLTNLGRRAPKRSCREVFEDSEWMSVCSILDKKVPKDPPELGAFMVMIGKLGGYQPRKSPPGVKVIWEGLRKMADYALMWEVMSSKYMGRKKCV